MSMFQVFSEVEHIGDIYVYDRQSLNGQSLKHLLEQILY
jgi:hypothetical protein